MTRFLFTGVAAAALAVCCLTLPASAQTANPAARYDIAPWWAGENVIAQTGTTYMEMPANRAGFSATFLTTGKTVEEAQAKASAQTRALNGSLATFGADKVRVTTSFSMRALYKQYRDKQGNRIEDERGDRIEGYEVSLVIAVEVRDMAALEKAYALVMAAAPTESSQVRFMLQPDNAANTALYSDALKDAKARAEAAAAANGVTLGAIRLIDPSGRACRGILGPARDEVVTVTGKRTATGYSYSDEITSDDVGAFPDNNVAESLQRVPGVTVSRYSAGSPEELEEKALNNPFIQTPPLLRRVATACVVYDLN